MKDAAPENLAALTAVTHFFNTLNQTGVRYCHWKSNIRLTAALQGQTDLDLLIDPHDKDRFRQIINQQGVKKLVAAPGRDYPQIENYLGFDPPSGQLFHLHVHYHLVLGEQLVKNYRLPLESVFLDSASLCQGVLIPAPELELIVLTLRALLKYRDRDAIRDILAIRAPGLPPFIQAEIAWLRAQTTPESLAQTLKTVADIVPVAVVTTFLQVVGTMPRNGRSLLQLRAQTRQALRPFQRRSRLQATTAYFRQVWRRNRLQPTPPRKMSLPAGGLSLAFVGADGSGKSTLTVLLRDWLAWKLDTRLFYLGSKQPSRRSQLLYLLFRLFRRGHRFLCRWPGETAFLTHGMARLRQTALYSHHLSLGRDRVQRYQAGQRATAVTIVIYDRFPLAPLLDGPKIAQAANGSANHLSSAFAQAEQAIYDQIKSPDYYFVLDVSPEVSWQRKPDHDTAVVAAKSRFLNEWVADGKATATARVLSFDADLPFTEVVRQVKMAVWEAL